MQCYLLSISLSISIEPRLTIILNALKLISYVYGRPKTNPLCSTCYDNKKFKGSSGHNMKNRAKSCYSGFQIE